MKVAAYTIAKNEAKQVQPYMESCRDADLVVIADIGSSDGTPDLPRQAGAVVHDICVKPWRFDLARTTFLCLLPAAVDVCVKMDLGERLQPGWRGELESAGTSGTTRLRYWYTWNWKAPGKPDVVFRNDLIHACAGYRWLYPTHEILQHSISESIADCELAIQRFPQAKTRPNDLPLLELAAEEHRCPRTLFYLDREHSFREEWTSRQKVLGEYLSLSDALDAGTVSRQASDWFLPQASRRPGGSNDLVSALLAEDPRLRENWLELAHIFYEDKDGSGCDHACERGLAVRERTRHYQSFAYAWGERLDDLASVCAWYMGMKDKSAEQLRAALAVNPDDARLQSNAKFILPEARPTTRTIWNLVEARTGHVHSPSFAKLLLSIFPKEDDVIDFGCGLGYYAAFLHEHGYRVSAVEGTEGISDVSLFKGVRTFDLSQPLSFDLPMSRVLCLEVGEHLLPDQEGVFLDNITRLCESKMAPTWAVPGQRSYGHHNERPNEYVFSQPTNRGFGFDKDQTSHLRKTTCVTKHGGFRVR